MYKTASEIADRVLVKVAESMDMEGATPEEFRDSQLRNIARMRGPLAAYGTGMGAIGGTALGGLLGKGKGAIIGAGIGAATGLGTALGANTLDEYIAQNATEKKMQDHLREYQEEIQGLRDAGVEDFELNPNHARNRLLGSSVLGALTGAATGGGIGLHGGRGLAGAGIGALAGAGTGLGLGALGNMHARRVEESQGS